jgi:rare lipoprotein A
MLTAATSATEPPSSSAVSPVKPRPRRHIAAAAKPGANGSQGGRRIAAGRAAWYEHPGRTASGEKFNPNQLTAAHHTLAFGTRLRVVNKKNGRSVVVRINDRIPRTTKFVIDLSRASAKAIGITGLAPVVLYQLDDSKPAVQVQSEFTRSPAAQRTAAKQ